MACSERSTKRLRPGSAIEGLLESSHEFAALVRTLDVADSSDRAQDPNLDSFLEHGEEDDTASLADHLRRVVQQRTLLQASGITRFSNAWMVEKVMKTSNNLAIVTGGAVEVIDRQFDALCPQLQVRSWPAARMLSQGTMLCELLTRKCANNCYASRQQPRVCRAWWTRIPCQMFPGIAVGLLASVLPETLSPMHTSCATQPLRPQAIRPVSLT